jgi:2,4-dienoyl-CoA reductase-like NADH-dependent reductase (Old Yellow Enzyme family)
MSDFQIDQDELLTEAASMADAMGYVHESEATPNEELRELVEEFRTASTLAIMAGDDGVSMPPSKVLDECADELEAVIDE